MCCQCYGILSHLVQCAGMTQRQRMTGLKTGEKLFIFFSLLLGSVQVVCGYLLLLLAVTNSWGRYPFPVKTTSLEIATSLIAIILGKCAIAFPCLRVKAFLRRGVLITSILSGISAVFQFLWLATSPEKHLQCNPEHSKSVTLLGTIINAIFLFFLFERSQLRSEVEDIDDAPPPYDVAVQNSNYQEGLGETRSPPLYRIHCGSLNQANLNSSYI